MTPIQRMRYTTADEASFIDNLGRQSVDGKVLGPLKVVEEYIKAANKRTNWGDIDGHAAIDYAKGRLRELRRNTVEARGAGRSFIRGQHEH